MSIGENIRYLRKQAKLTQKQLAQIVGVNEVTIRSYERGKYEPKTDVLYRLVKALDCNINEILDKPFTPPDLSMNDFEEIEGSGGIMIQKNSPLEAKEKIKKQILKSIHEMDKDVSDKPFKPLILSQDTLDKPITAPANTEDRRTITIDMNIDENHPFNIIQKKIDNGELLTPEELSQYKEHISKALLSICQALENFGESLKKSFSQYYALLNDKGQREADIQMQRAIERVTERAENQIKEEVENQIKLLTRIPEYQKKPDD